MKNIKLKGAKNLRDLGDSINIVKKCKLLRGPSLDNLTNSDINKLVNDYKLKAIIDLRTDREHDDREDVEIKNVDYYHMPIFSESTPGITHEEGNDLKSTKHINMQALYKEILNNEYLDNISKIIKKVISIKDGSVLIHCTEGKDRTGIIILILLSILGIDRETIIKDYLYTNRVNKKKAYKLYFDLKYFAHDPKRAERVRDIFLAKEEYINAIFETIDTKWFNVDNFIKQGLKITDEEIQTYKGRLLNK